MKKLSARWVQRLLTLDHKCTWVEMSKQNLSHFQWNKIFAPVCDHGWNLGPLLYPRDKTVVKAVESCWVTTTKKRKGHDLSFVGCKRHFTQLAKQLRGNTRQTSQTNYRKWYAKKTRVVKEKVIFHQDNVCSHISVIAMQKSKNWGTNCCCTALLAWFGTIRI